MVRSVVVRLDKAVSVSRVGACSGRDWLVLARRGSQGRVGLLGSVLVRFAGAS